MSQGHAMQRRSQPTQALVEEMQTEESSAISSDSNVGILTEMLSQTHLISQEEII